MDRFMTQLRHFITDCASVRCPFDTVSPTQMLYEFYSHRSPPETPELRACRQNLTQSTAHLSFPERDAILCSVNALCAELEKHALMEGIRLGARAAMEWSETTP